MQISAADVVVHAEAVFDAEHSEPLSSRYVFQYTVSIENKAKVALIVMTRNWVITDGERTVNVIHGLGVFGCQPHIEPGKELRYTSGTWIPTPTGTMKGVFQIQAEGKNTFGVPIPEFQLVATIGKESLAE